MGCGSSAPAANANVEAPAATKAVLEEKKPEKVAEAPVAAAAPVADDSAAKAKAAEEEAAKAKAAEEEAAKAKAAEEAKAKTAEEEAAKAKTAGEEAASVKVVEEVATKENITEEEAAKAKAVEEEAAKHALELDALQKQEQKDREAAASRKAEVLAAEKYKNYNQFIPGKGLDGETILLSTKFSKKSGGVAGHQIRQLILTNKPGLYYVDLEKKQTKGTILWFPKFAPKAQMPLDGTDDKLEILALESAEMTSPRLFEFKITDDKDVPLSEWVAKVNQYNPSLKAAGGI